MAKVFAYKGYIGIDVFTGEPVEEGKDVELKNLSPALIVDPLQPGQLGFLCDASKCEFTKEAVELLQETPKSRHSIGDVMCYEGGGMTIFGWMGGGMRAFKAEEAQSSRDCDMSLLKNVKTVEIEVPQNFIDYIDSL